MRNKLPDDLEIRDSLWSNPEGDVELRQVAFRADDAQYDGIPGYDGYISTWNTVDSYGTFFTKGSFKKTINERRDDAPVLWQHWPDMPIGNHLDIKEDKTGVYVNTQLIEGVRAADEALALMRGGVHLGLSFGFKTIKDRTATDDDEIDFSVAPEFKKAPRDQIRAITEIALFESSPVTFAANAKAGPSKVRSLADADFLTSLLDAIKDGTVDDVRAGLVAQLVAAWGERAGAGPDHSTPEQARRNRDIDVSLALRKMEGLLSGDYSWA